MILENEKLDENFLVKAENVGIEFKIAGAKYDTLKERAIALFKRDKQKVKKFQVLLKVMP